MAERLTVLLSRMQAGDRAARDAVFAAAYKELKRLAHARLRDGGRNTVLDTTALVHESYERFVKVGQLRIEDRRAFFGYASQVMRSVIVDSARARKARGGNAPKMTLSIEAVEGVGQDEEAILQMDEALKELEKADAQAAKMVQMRYFGGYSDKEIAETLNVDVRTVSRISGRAKMLLQVILKPA